MHGYPNEAHKLLTRPNATRMSLFDRFLMWRKARRLRLHRRWLKKSRVILPEPDPRCRRNSVEAVP
jgi:hypothetical protein